MPGHGNGRVWCHKWKLDAFSIGTRPARGYFDFGLEGLGFGVQETRGFSIGTRPARGHVYWGFWAP